MVRMIIHAISARYFGHGGLRLLFLVSLLYSGCANIDSNCKQKTEIESLVANLEHDHVFVRHLGRYRAVGTTTTERIVMYGDTAVPVLVKALEVAEGKPLLLGYIAFCLRHLHAESGRLTAAKLHNNLDAREEKLNWKERFAWLELYYYLEDLKHLH